MADLNILTPTGAANTTGASVANKFSMASQVYVTEIKFYKWSTSAPPSRIYFYNVDTSTIDWQRETPPSEWHLGADGWYHLYLLNEFGTNFAPWVTYIYKLTAYMENLGTISSTAGHSPAPDSPATLYRSYSQNSATANPATEGGVNVWFGLDMVWQTSSPTDPTGSQTDPEGTDPSQEQDLAQWLQDGNPLLRDDSLPKINHDAIVAARAEIDKLVTHLDANGWPVVFGGVNRANLPAWLTAAGSVLSAVSDIVSNIQTAIGTPGDPEPDSVLAELLALQGQVFNGDQRYLTQPGGAGWTLDVTVPFAGPFVVDQDADVIFVNVTTHGEENRINVYGGLEFLTFAWWWVPLRAGAIAGRYHTSRALQADLYEPGRRLGGALVVVPPDFEGEYEVWRYTG